MDLEDYSLDMLLQAAIKAEEQASETYDLIADLSLSPDLEQFLNEITEEEKKHRKKLEEMFNELYSDKEVALPEDSPVPLPDIEAAVECDGVEEMLKHIINVEKKASDFYRSLAQRFKKNGKEYNALLYLSKMEHEHFERFESLLDDEGDLEGKIEGSF